jgi:hypothetical protein
VYARPHDAALRLQCFLSFCMSQSRFHSVGIPLLDYDTGRSNIKSTFYSRSSASRSMALLVSISVSLESPCSWKQRCETLMPSTLIQFQQISKSKITFISFSTLRKKVPYEIDAFISTRGKSLAALRKEIVALLPAPLTSPPSATANLTSEPPFSFHHEHQTLI